MSISQQGDKLRKLCPENNNYLEKNQTDQLNQKLLVSFLNKLNRGEVSTLCSENDENEDQLSFDFVDQVSVDEGTSLTLQTSSLSNNTTLRPECRPLIVGISGGTNAGKTTLACHLVDMFAGQAILILQDTYFLPPDTDKLPIQPDINHKIWDTLDALDMDKMITELRDLQTNLHRIGSQKNIRMIIILDGFLIFNHSELYNLCDIKIFLQVPEHVSKERRKHRVYDPPDVPGYVDKYVWPLYLKHRAEIQHLTDVKYLDGTISVESLAKTVLQDIYTFIN